MRFYGEIRRVDEEQRMVWGYASTEKRAMDGKIVTRGAMAGALDDYMAFANIREMHQPSAVGVAREAMVDEGGLYIGAHVVDDVAWKKVKEKVYRGFSIGAKITDTDPADATVVTGILIREISLVDRPADPGAVFDVWRAADGDDEPQPTREASPGADLEEDMSRAAARKPEAQASTEPAAPTLADHAHQGATDGEVTRAAEGETAAPADPAPASEAAPEEPAVERTEAAPAAAEAEAASAGGEAAEVPVERAAEGEGETAGPAEPAPEDPVARAVATAREAMSRADAAINLLNRRETGDVPEPLRAGLEMRRGMSEVSRLGYLLSELAFVIFDANWEARQEGDASPVPAKLRDALEALIAAYKAMSDEELAELLKSVDMDLQVEKSLIIYAADSGDLQRATPRPVGDELAVALQSVFDGFVQRGWTPASAQTEPDDLRRQVEDLTAGRETLLRTIEGLSGKVSDLAADVERLSGMAAPPKTGGALARAVDKAEDVAGVGPGPAAPTTEEVQRVLEAMSQEERALLLIRAAHTQPRAVTR